MNRTDLIERVASETGLIQADARRAVDPVIENIVKATRHDPEGARIGGLGIFTTKRREASTGRNPRTGETVEIAARTAVKFSPAKVFKDQVNGR